MNADISVPAMGGARRYRVAADGDIDAVVALVNSAYRGDSSRQGWTTEADLLGGQRTDRDEVAGLVAAPGSMLLLCVDGEQLIGSVHLEHAGDAAWLGMFTVRPGLQGRGIGRQFMVEAERVARQTWGVTRMRMAVIWRRHELIGWYERRGYRRTGERKVFPDHPRYGIPKVDDLELELLEKRFSD